MLDGVNDSPDHARALVGAASRDVPCKFNLIPFEPVPGHGIPHQPARADPRVPEDAASTRASSTTIRKTRGDDIDAACGQLVGRVRDRTKRTVRIQPARATPATH